MPVQLKAALDQLGQLTGVSYRCVPDHQCHNQHKEGRLLRRGELPAESHPEVAAFSSVLEGLCPGCSDCCTFVG